MNTLHHPHLMAADLDATIAFWRDGLGDQVIAELDFAGACNVCMRVGHGRLHLHDQPPRTNERSTVHHLGVQTDELEHLVGRLRDMGVSVTTSATSPAPATRWPKVRTGCSSSSSNPISTSSPPSGATTSTSAPERRSPPAHVRAGRGRRQRLEGR